jgi:hypothetical protein
VRPANLKLVQVARNSVEALQWIEQQRHKVSLNQDVGAQDAGRLKPQVASARLNCVALRARKRIGEDAGIPNC